MKLFIIGGLKYYAWWTNAEIVDFDEADVVMFTGGADVLPALYGDSMHRMTRAHGSRDAKEINYFAKSLSLGKKMIGICRGSQFLTVMNGGELIQDVSNHAINDEHPITSEYGEGTITSTHHQMMYPYNLPEDNYEIVAHPPQNMSKHYEKGQDKAVELPENFVEPEIVWYPKTQCLGIQGHPERLNIHSDGLKLCQQIVNQYLGE